jgi:sensor histidine kinase regulating citrate/malate metabolism
MLSLRNLPIQKRIVAIIMIVSCGALVLVSGELIAYDYLKSRSDLVSATASAARIIADNSTAAVAFHDQRAANDTLAALTSERSIVAACIYTPSELFAQYFDQGDAACPAHLPVDGFSGGHLVVSHPIELDGKQLGVVSLRATLAPMYGRLRVEIATIVGIFLLAALFAFNLSSRLNKLDA